MSKETWPDFERLFLKPAGLVGDGWWCWCTFHHVSSFSLPENEQLPTRGERSERNHRKKRSFVENGGAHGILVYFYKEPVGWCQYGSGVELPRVDHSRNYRKLGLVKPDDRFWRITCFVVDRKHRRRGVASLGLKTALEAIRKKGGGLVEAYPVQKTDQGPNYLYSGTVSMFKRAGFKMIGPFGTGRTSTVVMQRTI